MFFLKLPETMPLLKQLVKTEKTEDQEVAGSSKPLKGAGSSTKTCSLNELPPCYMGKMLVYRSGAVKLKLGDTLYDVSTCTINHKIYDNLRLFLYKLRTAKIKSFWTDFLTLHAQVDIIEDNN